MAKRLLVTPSTLAYLARKLACVEERRGSAPDAGEIAHLLAAMHSPDESSRRYAP